MPRFRVGQKRAALLLRLRQLAAQRQRARVADLHPQLETERTGRQITYRQRIGPLASVAEADTTLARVLRAGIPDARIVVE